MITLLAIAHKKQRNAPMDLLPYAEVSLAQGVEGDVFGKPGKRQVTLLSQQQWQQACAQLQTELPWTSRRANLLLDGLEFAPELVGKYLKIGEQLVLELTGETDPCGKMERAYPGLEAALTPAWRGGCTAKVINPGKIRPQDPVQVLDSWPNRSFDL
ncbi:MOSC domain-containing protein [Shewanella algae]|uniref:MOSC domain-containing protein n=1 Tax=Shewanella algae TaxID=38313 RepID=UPI0005CDC744|nr:MOSC domain-containing protein [Shewanella algae]MBC8796876.1 MOSC domain-containing protein [Shewanella algae]MBO2563193.1 MOSC domain-containing protein [Shewanella algae]MBO2584671.1 MOSC domain-containing protein [Shewanella algae]MBO2635065.1 MOSC domain-containing protein [Shewanella algae]MBO2677255.1 MOSC domain-containing protein [Shewanella algae]